MLLPNIAPLQPCVIVYTKNPLPLQVAEQLPYATVQWQQNIGREATAYLDYFIRHYHDCAEQVLMVHGGFESNEAILDKLSAVQLQTGFMCLHIWTGMACDGNEYWGLGEDTELHDMWGDVRLREIWAMVRHAFCFDKFAACLRGEFLVSAKRIRQNPLKLYRNLFDAFLLPESHVVYRDIELLKSENKWESSPADPLLGHTLERAWAFMFDCHHLQAGQNYGHHMPLHYAKHQGFKTVLTGSSMAPARRFKHFGIRNCSCFHPTLAGGPATFPCTPQEKQNACQCID
jgi:hypothetical protein